MKKLYYRKTYINIYPENIKNNVSEIKKKFNDYKYYIGVVKNNAYNHRLPCVYKAMEKGGINFYAVSLLEEAIELRNYTKKGIVVFEPIDTIHLNVCAKNNISITVENLDYLKKVIEKNINDLKIHLKIDTGMNRFGIKDINEIKEAIELCKDKVNLEGIYTHIYYSENESVTKGQYELFNKIIDEVKPKVKMIHISNSEALVNYPKCECVNGIRIGDLIYAITPYKKIKQYPTFQVVSHVIKVKKLKKGESIGYDSSYTASKDEYIALIPIGYSDGFRRSNTDSYVYINGKKCRIVGKICMDITYVKVSSSVKEGDIAYVIRDPKHIFDIADHLGTVATEVLCLINDRVPRVEVK